MASRTAPSGSAAELDQLALGDELTRQQLAEHQPLDDRLVGLKPQRRRAHLILLTPSGNGAGARGAGPGRIA